MFWSKKKKETKTAIQWHSLTDIEQIDQLIKESKTQSVCIFKHSTRCSLSSTVLNRLERKWDDKLNEINMYYLDLIAHRDVSNAVADKTSIEHQSPQLILLKGGKVVYSASHTAIDAESLLKFV
ncbi:MAG: bacillithiol system redox-active protein YtxJ [Chitinophagales bacterium]